ncbi:MAG: bifunctional glutamate N-acetyltransferase/amino-acid acetyltransferase ArgJ, partial [Pseudomonadota bacterium]
LVTTADNGHVAVPTITLAQGKWVAPSSADNVKNPNAGNANAFTGQIGMQSVNNLVKATADLLDCDNQQVFVASTGVIGEPLHDEKIIAKLPELKANLQDSDWTVAARAIMTTDTFMKIASIESNIGGKKVIINGFVKGSGMIAPNMATMLGFVFTDAKTPAKILQEIVAKANLLSFNSITVDGDTSTNDTFLAFASAEAKNAEITSLGDANLQDFIADFNKLAINLATQIVKDGEGASKFVSIEVNGAENDAAARKIAMTVANSPLVKTAIAASDANWGRIVAAIGRSGENIVQEKLDISIGGIAIAKSGERLKDYDETPVAAHMLGENVDITIGLNIGGGKATVYTCDLTHEYISINADYRS